MMATYLLTWNPIRWHWKNLQMTEKKFDRARPGSIGGVAEIPGPSNQAAGSF
jgi:hypothetical protein